jgi:hypothetical protein
MKSIYFISFAFIAVNAQNLTHFVLSTDFFRSMEKPVGNPSTSNIKVNFETGDPIVDQARFDYYGNLVKEEGVLQAGNCCIRGADKQEALCGQRRECCSVCTVSGADIIPDANDRIHYVAAFKSAFTNQQAPPGEPNAKLKMVVQTSETIVSEFNNFDYYGKLTETDSVYENGTCCVRGVDSQKKTCGSSGSCCASCLASSVTVEPR